MGFLSGCHLSEELFKPLRAWPCLAGTLYILPPRCNLGLTFWGPSLAHSLRTLPGGLESSSSELLSLNRRLKEREPQRDLWPCLWSKIWILVQC